MFSPNEQKILKILGESRMTVTQITDKFYKGQVTPMNASIIVSNALSRIVKKCDHYNQTWTIKSEGTGRGGKTVWKVKR